MWLSWVSMCIHLNAWVGVYFYNSKKFLCRDLFIISKNDWTFLQNFKGKIIINKTLFWNGSIISFFFSFLVCCCRSIWPSTHIFSSEWRVDEFGSNIEECQQVFLPMCSVALLVKWVHYSHGLQHPVIACCLATCEVCRRWFSLSC